jgi:hypothetical protein
VDVNVPVRQLKLELEDELVHDHGDDFRREVAERHDRIEAVAEFGREHPLDRFLVLASRVMLPKPTPSRAMSLAPALVVMIRMTLRKSTVLPW